MKGRGWRTRLNKLSKTKKLILVLVVFLAGGLLVGGSILSMKKITNSNSSKKPNNGTTSSPQNKVNKKELSAEQKKLASEREKKLTEQKAKTEPCKGYYEQLDKYTKSITDKNNDRNKKIRELAQKYPVESEEYKSALSEINEQYSGIISSSKPPSKPQNC